MCVCLCVYKDVWICFLLSWELDKKKEEPNFLFGLLFNMNYQVLYFHTNNIQPGYISFILCDKLDTFKVNILVVHEY